MNSMEEKISYRKLKNPKKTKVQGISQSLLKLPAHRQTVNLHDKNIDITNKNVSMYEYMLANSYIKQNYINWAINLRSHPQPNKKDTEGEGNVDVRVPTQSEPYPVFFKSTKLTEIRAQLKEASKSINTAQYSQYFSKSTQNFNSKNSATKQQVDYFNNLRNYNSSLDKQNKIRFNNDAGKNTYATNHILKKTAIKKVRDIQNSDKQNGLDGTHNFPPYTYNVLRQKNIALLNNLIKKGDKVSLPGVAWAVGLRTYDKIQNFGSKLSEQALS